MARQRPYEMLVDGEGHMSLDFNPFNAPNYKGEYPSTPEGIAQARQDMEKFVAVLKKIGIEAEITDATKADPYTAFRVHFDINDQYSMAQLEEAIRANGGPQDIKFLDYSLEEIPKDLCQLPMKKYCEAMDRAAEEYQKQLDQFYKEQEAMFGQSATESAPEVVEARSTSQSPPQQAPPSPPPVQESVAAPPVEAPPVQPAARESEPQTPPQKPRDTVKFVQEMLHKCGEDVSFIGRNGQKVEPPAAFDGIAGKATNAALQSFAQKHGIDLTGIDLNKPLNPQQMEQVEALSQALVEEVHAKRVQERAQNQAMENSIPYRELPQPLRDAPYPPTPNNKGSPQSMGGPG